MNGRIRVASGAPGENRFGYSRAVRVGDRVLVSGTTGLESGGSFARTPAARRHAPS